MDDLRGDVDTDIQQLLSGQESMLVHLAELEKFKQEAIEKDKEKSR